MCSQIKVGSEWQGPECSVVGQGETGLEEKVDVGVGGTGQCHNSRDSHFYKREGF